jgi:hypothetical protein
MTRCESPTSVLDFFTCYECEEVFYCEDAFMYDLCPECQEYLQGGYNTQDEGEQTE